MIMFVVNFVNFYYLCNAKGVGKGVGGREREKKMEREMLNNEGCKGEGKEKSEKLKEKMKQILMMKER